MFILIIIPSPHKNNLRAEKIFCMPRWDFYGVCSTTVKKVAPCDIFFSRNHESNCVAEWNEPFMSAIVFIIEISCP